MDFRQAIEDWRITNGKGEAEMATILGFGDSQQVYNKFKNNKKKTFPFEAAIRFQKVSGINLLDFTTDRSNRSKESDKRAEVQLIGTLAKGTEALEEDHHRLVRSHEMLVETKTSLTKHYLSLGVNGLTSPFSQEKGPLLPDPRAKMQGKPGTDSEKKEDTQKDTSENSDM